MNESSEEIIKNVDVEPTAFFHIRRGDYWSNPQFGTLDDDYLNRAFSQLSCSSEMGKVAVFSEDYFPSGDLFGGIEVIKPVTDICNEPEIFTVMSKAKHLVVANS